MRYPGPHPKRVGALITDT